MSKARFPDTTLGRQQELLFRLLYDAPFRARFSRTPQAVISAEGIAPAVAAPFVAVAPWRIDLEAEGRADYLFAALCRQMPLSSAAIGAALGTAPFETFLASPALFLRLGARGPAFAATLRQAANELPGPPLAQSLVQAIVGVEAARVEASAALRGLAERGEIGVTSSPSGVALKPEARLILPPHLVVGEWPAPTALLQNALAGAQAQTAWHLVRTGSLDWQRLVTVARGDATPVTLVCRAVVVHVSSGGAGVRPVVEVSQRIAELPGRQGPLFQGVAAGARLRDLSPADQSLAAQLVRGGLLETAGG